MLQFKHTIIVECCFLYSRYQKVENSILKFFLHSMKLNVLTITCSTPLPDLTGGHNRLIDAIEFNLNYNGNGREMTVISTGQSC